MSNAAAIAAVTDGLRNRLAAAGGLGGATVTIDPLDKLAGGAAGNPALNLHLYQILPNAHWRNTDVPWKPQPGDTRHAPLALDLRYLLTATAPLPTDAQRHLGVGMQVLHDNPVLDPGGAAAAPFERARISMHPLSLDDMEKLWAGASIPRRLSVAYEVSVVLIESEQPTRSPLPVLSRGIGRPDSIEVQARLYPTIERIEIGDTAFDNWLRGGSRPGRTTAQIEDKIFVYGQGLTGDETKTAVIFSLMHPAQELELDGLGTDDRGGLVVDLSRVDFAAEKFPAGPCSIRIMVKGHRDNPDITNSVPFSLAPTITSITPKAAIALPGNIKVDFKPPLIAGQSVVLIIANRQISPKGPASPATFGLENLDPDDYPIRLRVDGVDSIVVNLTKGVSGTDRPVFANSVSVKKKS